MKYDAWTNITITLASLAAAAGRGSSPIANPDNRGHAQILFSPSTGGTAPTADTVIEGFILRQDDSAATSGRTDLWTAADAALTVINANLGMVVGVSATANTNFPELFDTAPLGPLGGSDSQWGIAVRNGTNQALHGTEGNHKKRFRYYVPES
jgi:hypothetical protein